MRAGWVTSSKALRGELKRSPSRASRAFSTSSASTATNTPLVTDDAEFLRRIRGTVPMPAASGFRSFFSSELGGSDGEGAVTTSARHLHVPLDDHGFHRGHAVFDTANVAGGYAYGLDFHIDRLLRSAEGARIDHSFSREWLKGKIKDCVAASGKRDDVLVKYWMTAGRGGFGISPRGECPRASFYVLVHDYVAGEDGLSAVFVRESEELPFKPPKLAGVKSNNYLLNALLAMHAEDEGAQLGIGVRNGSSSGGGSSDYKVGEERVLEGPIGNAAALGADGILRAPAYNGELLAGTSLARAAEIVNDETGGHGLGGGAIKRVEFCNALSTSYFYEAREILSFGGGYCRAVTSLDGEKVGTGVPGPGYASLAAALRKDIEGNASLRDAVPYGAYEGIGRPGAGAGEDKEDEDGADKGKEDGRDWISTLSGSLCKAHAAGNSSPSSSPLAVGDVATASREFSAAEVAEFVRITGDANPIHAATTDDGTAPQIVPGILVASLFPAVFAACAPGSVYASQDLRFRRAVLAGERTDARIEVRAVRGVPGGAAGEVFATCETIVNVSGEAAVTGEAVVRVPGEWV